LPSLHDPHVRDAAFYSSYTIRQGANEIARSLIPILSAIKHDIGVCEYGSAHQFLRGANSPEELIAFREQKVLFRGTDRQAGRALASSYSAAAARLLGSSDQGRFEQNYADFTHYTKDVLDIARANTRSVVSELPRLSLSELLSILDRLINGALDELSSIAWDDAGPQLKTLLTVPSESAAIASRTFHQIVGSTNDVLFACARVLNETASDVDSYKTYRSGRAVQDAASAVISRLISLCSTQNSLEYMVNMVTYGEWVVSAIDAGTQLEITFALADPALDYARTLALRRDHIRFRARLKKTTFMAAEVISSYLEPFVERCLDYFARSGRPVAFRRSPDQLSQLCDSLKAVLGRLERDDDILLATTNSPELLSHYLAGVALRWFAEICRFTAKRCASRHRHEFEMPTIHADVLGSLMGGEDGISKDITIAIPHFCRTLPLTRHLDIIAYPFFNLPDGRILCISGMDAGRWPVTVRSKWLQGGYSGDNYGKIWETYIAYLFESRQWQVAGRNVKLRSEGRTITDVDLLVMRDEFLLVIQIKALIGYGADPYEQWKGRNVVSAGARQANVAGHFLRDNAKWLTGLFGASAASRISKVQPLVVTNLNLFNGWLNDQVPVVSVSGLNDILAGAKVFYTRDDGQVVGEESSVAPEAMTAEAFMDLIRNPLDWRLAKESFRMAHTMLETGGVRWRIPSAMGGWAIGSTVWGSA
jgi:hypothetical protein